MSDARYIAQVETTKRKHGADFYSKLGEVGGKWKGRKGFSMMPKERLREIAIKGGKLSRRKPKR